MAALHIAQIEYLSQELIDVRQDKSGAFSGCDSRLGKSGARSPGIESWAHRGNDMS